MNAARGRAIAERKRQLEEAAAAEKQKLDALDKELAELKGLLAEFNTQIWLEQQRPTNKKGRPPKWSAEEGLGLYQAVTWLTEHQGCRGPAEAIRILQSDPSVITHPAVHLIQHWAENWRRVKKKGKWQGPSPRELQSRFQEARKTREPFLNDLATDWG